MQAVVLSNAAQGMSTPTVQLGSNHVAKIKELSSLLQPIQIREFQMGNLSFSGYFHLLVKTLNINSLDLMTGRCPLFISRMIQADHVSSVEWSML